MMKENADSRDIINLGLQNQTWTQLIAAVCQQQRPTECLIESIIIFTSKPLRKEFSLFYNLNHNRRALDLVLFCLYQSLKKPQNRYTYLIFKTSEGGLSQHVSNLARGIQCILAKNLACSSCGIQGGISSQQKLFPLLKPFALLTFQIGGKQISQGACPKLNKKPRFQFLDRKGGQRRTPYIA